MDDPVLVSPAGKVLVRAPLAALQVDAFEVLSCVDAPPPDIYGVLNRPEGIVVQRDRPSPEMIRRCLALPEDTDPRFRALAARLVEGAPGPEERLRRTLAHVEGACAYSLSIGRLSSPQPVAEFLFERKQGYCQYFASAAAILLRLEGVACRYVTGFAVQAENRAGGHYVVRECDAHAWLEAYLPGRGWVEADPTPAAELAAVHERFGGGALRDAIEWLRGKWAEIAVLWRRVSLRGLGGALRERCLALVRAALERPAIATAAAALAVLAALAWRRRRRAGARAAPGRGIGRPEVPADLRRLLDRTDAVLARRGHRRSPSRAPLEHLASIPEEKLPPALRAAAGRAIEAFYRVCFAGGAAGAEEIAALRRELDAAARR